MDIQRLRRHMRKVMLLNFPGSDPALVTIKMRNGDKVRLSMDAPTREFGTGARKTRNGVPKAKNSKFWEPRILAALTNNPGGLHMEALWKKCGGKKRVSRYFRRAITKMRQDNKIMRVDGVWRIFSDAVA